MSNEDYIKNIGTKIRIDNFDANIRLVDCVGYIIPGKKGKKVNQMLQ